MGETFWPPLYIICTLNYLKNLSSETCEYMVSVFYFNAFRRHLLIAVTIAAIAPGVGWNNATTFYRPIVSAMVPMA